MPLHQAHFLRSLRPRISRLPLCGTYAVGALPYVLAHYPPLLYNLRWGCSVFKVHVIEPAIF